MAGPASGSAPKDKEQPLDKGTVDMSDNPHKDHYYIDGKIYDFSDWQKIHPGGDVFFRCSFQRDISALVHAYHRIFVILAALIYVFAIILTQGATEHMQGSGVRDEGLSFYFGTLFTSMYTLFKAMSGGVNWADVSDAMTASGGGLWPYEVIFCAYMFFCLFAHGRDPGALDAAVEPRLELGFCREKNNLLLRLVEGRGGPAECPRYYRERPEADRGGAPRRPPEAPPRPTAPPPSCRGAAAEAAAAEPPRCRGARRGAPEEACAAQRARDELADTAGAADPEGCLAGARGRGRSPSCRGRARSLAGEPEGSVEPFRSRSEPPLGRRVPDLYDDPFEPPPQELWSTHAAAPPVPFASAGYAALAGPGAAAPPPCPLFLGVLVPAALLAAPTPARLAAGTRGDAAACKASSAPASPRPRPVLGAQGAPGARGA